MTVSKNTFSDNKTDGRYNQYGGAAYIYDIGSISVEKNTFSGNYASDDGGALRIADATSTVTLSHNIISNNSSGDGPGGVCIDSRYGNADTIKLSNNLVINNYTSSGTGGVYLNDQDAVFDIVNNTIVKNYSNSTAAGGLRIYDKGSALRIYNNIIQNNENSSGDQDITSGVTIDQLFNNNFRVISGTADYENANIDVDPSFVSVDDDDYHLSSASPCIDTGNNLAYEISTEDLEGTNRIINDFVDMGAYEYVGTADNPVCSEGHPELCNCEYDCEWVGNAWWQGACYDMSAYGGNGSSRPVFTGELAENIQSYLTLTDASVPFYLASGSYVQTFGSTGSNTVNVEIYARIQCKNFVGANEINIEEASSEFTVYRSGATVYLNSTAGTRVEIAATETSQILRFADGSLELAIINGSVMLGSQLVDETEKTIEAVVDDSDTSEDIF